MRINHGKMNVEPEELEQQKLYGAGTIQKMEGTGLAAVSFWLRMCGQEGMITIDTSSLIVVVLAGLWHSRQASA